MVLMSYIFVIKVMCIMSSLLLYFSLMFDQEFSGLNFKISFVSLPFNAHLLILLDLNRPKY